MITLLKIESKREPWIDIASKEYEKKISRLVSFNIKGLKGEKLTRTDANLKRSADSDILQKNINKTDLNILFDEHGKRMDSFQFADVFAKFQNSGKKHCNLLIGGPYGVSDDFKKNMQLVVSLSDLTFNHWIAELVILEQVYRAFSIIKNLPYHNE
jgi:23S rRNA (pseudouridine1915-N3)-methyltransferase